MGSLFYEMDGRRVDSDWRTLSIGENTAPTTEYLDLRKEILCGLQFPAAWTAAGLTFEHQIPGLGNGTVTAAAVNVGDTVTVRSYTAPDNYQQATFTAAAAENLAASQFNQAAGNNATATSLAACINYATGIGMLSAAADANAAVVTVTPVGADVVFNLTSSDAGRLAVANPWRPVYDSEGDIVALTVVARGFQMVQPADFTGGMAIRLLSGTSAVPVLQADDRTIYAVVRRRFDS